MADGLIHPDPGAVVRGYLKVAGRTIVGQVRALGPDGLDLETSETPGAGEGTFRCLGRAGHPPVAWNGRVEPRPGGARIHWSGLGKGQWSTLCVLMGLPENTPFPERVSLPSPPERRSLPLPRLPPLPSIPPASTPAPAPAASAPAATTPAAQAPAATTPRPAVDSAPARGEPVPASPLTTTEVLAAARGASPFAPPRARTLLVHVPVRPLAQVLARSQADLSPMVELDGVKGLNPRDVFAAHVAVGESALLLEGTVITVRGSRARVRLTIPSADIRALLERSA